jgi:radical SAM protein with 4Fe4S-binding SPASM domain
MSLDLAGRLLMLVSEQQIKRVTVIGGEPTVWPHLLSFNQLCHDAGIETTLVTNGVRFGDEAFWEDFLLRPNTKVAISIKAHDASSTRELTGLTAFGQFVVGIKRALAHFKTGVSTVFNAGCADSLPDIARFAMDCGARSLSVSLCTPAVCGQAVDRTWVMDPKETVTRLVRLYPLLNQITRGQLTFSMKLPLCLWPKSFIEMLVHRNQISTVCQLQQRIGLVFDTDGKLAVCNSLFDFPVGRFGESFSTGDELVAFMNSAAVTGVYNKLTSYPAKACVGCKMYEKCAGGCPLFWLAFDPSTLIAGW